MKSGESTGGDISSALRRLPRTECADTPAFREWGRYRRGAFAAASRRWAGVFASSFWGVERLARGRLRAHRIEPVTNRVTRAHGGIHRRHGPALGRGVRRGFARSVPRGERATANTVDVVREPCSWLAPGSG